MQCADRVKAYAAHVNVRLEVDPEAEPRLLTALLPVVPRVLREQVRDALRDAILSASLPPGTRVGEVETATALGVSRTPVREAIRELVQEGLLAFAPHRGAVVVTVSDDEINSSYKVKSVLEEEAMARAADRLTEEDFATLRRTVLEMDDLAARGMFLAANDAEWRFHTKIADVAQLGLLRRTWTSVDDLGRLTTLQLFARHGSFPKYLSVLAARHRDLIGILEGRDPQMAAEAGRAHLDEMHQVFLADIDDAEKQANAAQRGTPPVLGS